MKFKRPMIVGLGSLGSILCRKFAENGFEKVSIIDYDVVNKRNLKNSEFVHSDIGKKKVDVLYERFIDQIRINKFDRKFDEFKCNDIYDSDLFIDCRDFLYNREDIDIRLFVYNKSLIMDCRSTVNYSTLYEGSYFWTVTKKDLNLLLDKFIKIIKTGEIENFIQSKQVSEISLSKNLENTPVIFDPNDSKFSDIVMDTNSKISNPEVLNKINTKKTKKVNIKFCEANTRIRTKTLDINEISNELDIINEISSIIPKFDNNNYLLILENNEILIIPETGAA